MPEVIERVKNAWSAFMNRDPPRGQGIGYYGGSNYRPDRVRLTRGNERSIVAPIYNKIAMDCASISLQHVKIDANGDYQETVKSKLNNCLSLNANKDQSAREFIQDAVLSMFDEGVVALPPIDIYTSRSKSGGIQNDIGSIRTGRVIEWFPDYVKIRTYNDQTGKPADLMMPKSMVPIIENPLYSVMNDRNSTVQRLIQTLNLSDTIDSQNASGKLDMIIQLPYNVRTSVMRAKADERRKEIEEQLIGSKYGIAYIDGTEHITQLNRAVENNLYERVDYLWKLLYSQLGITEDILNGTANESTMQNYYTRTIEPIVSLLVDQMRWKYLSQKARDDGETIMMFRDPFKLVPINSLADAADKFTRNEIMSPNEWRPIVGRKPVKDEAANELRNRNINSSEPTQPATAIDTYSTPDEL